MLVVTLREKPLTSSAPIESEPDDVLFTAACQTLSGEIREGALQETPQQVDNRAGVVRLHGNQRTMSEEEYGGVINKHEDQRQIVS